MPFTPKERLHLTIQHISCKQVYLKLNKKDFSPFPSKFLCSITFLGLGFVVFFKINVDVLYLLPTYVLYLHICFGILAQHGEFFYAFRSIKSFGYRIFFERKEQKILAKCSLQANAIF